MPNNSRKKISALKKEKKNSTEIYGILLNRPYVILNMAQSINGFISGPSGSRVVISSTEDRDRVLKMRGESDGILVGSQTVENDNPELTTPYNPDLVRIVIDPDCRLKGNFKIMDGSRRTFVLNSIRDEVFRNGVEFVKCKKPFDLAFALEILKDRGISRLLVEGGEFTAGSFLKSGFVDEFYIFIGNLILPNGGKRTPFTLKEARNVIVDANILNGGILLKLDASKFKGNENEE